LDLELQKFLRRFTCREYGFAALEKQYSIKAKQHSRVPNLYLFKYSQIDSPFSETIVQESRGIILDANNNWAVVAMPYKKFFNHDEALASTIDWTTAKVWEKLDGSLVTMYYYGNKWWVATSGTPDANTPIGDFGMTFESLFWSTFKKEGIKLALFYPLVTYMFELCAPQNRVVVQHAEAKLFLHGVRHNQTLWEYDPDLAAARLNCRLPQSYKISSIGGCLEAVKHLQPLKNEGFVICDAWFRRVKVKSLDYIILHHAKDRLMSRRKMAMLIRDGEASEFQTALEAFPELAEEFHRLNTKYQEMIKSCNDCYAQIGGIIDQKSFAVSLVKYFDTTPEAIIFRMRKTGCTPQAAMNLITIPSFLRLMGVRE